MRYLLGLAFGLMLPIAAFAQSSSPIAGTWSLVSLSEDHQGTITHPLGDKHSQRQPIAVTSSRFLTRSEITRQTLATGSTGKAYQPVCGSPSIIRMHNPCKAYETRILSNVVKHNFR